MEKYERLHKLRKEVLKLSCAEFAKSLNVSGGQISKIETNVSNLSERLANDICDKYHVNYQWLMDGEDVPIFVDDKSVIDEIVKEYNLNDNEKYLLEYYLNNPAKRAYLIQELKLLTEGMKKDGQ